MDKAIALLIFVSMIATITYLSNQLNIKSKEVLRMSDNVSYMNDTIHRFKVNDSLNAIKIGQLKLTNEELLEYRKNDAETIKDLGIKIKNISNTVKIKTETVYIIKDSIKYVSDSLKVINHRSEWFDIDVNIYSDTYDLKAVSRDSLYSVAYKERPKKFLFIKYGRWKYKQIIMSYNPYSDIKYAEYINIIKK